VNYSKRKHFIFIKTFFISVVLLFAILSAFNYIVDSYYVFTNNSEEMLVKNTVNDRFVKTNYLKNHCTKYDAMIFGSSRSAAYRTKHFNKIFKVNSYNYSATDDTPIGVLQKLNWLHSIGCMPKKIFISISNDRLHLRDYTKIMDLLTLEHPYVSKNSGHYPVYLTSFSVTLANLRSIFKYEKNTIKYDISTGDVLYLWDNEFESIRCPDINTERSEHAIISKQVVDDFVEVIFKINRLAYENSSKVFLFWAPIQLKYQLIHTDLTIHLLEKLSTEFDLINRVPISDSKLFSSNNYHDWSHFKDTLSEDVALNKSISSFSKLIDEIKIMKNICTSLEVDSN
jgi:hypothetical protein